jgi:hypothetical protein
MGAFEIYWLLHVIGLFMALMALGGLAAHVANGGGRDHRFRAPLAAVHGLGLLLALVGGFGMQARGGFDWAGWLYVKIAVWLAFGGLYAVLLRKPGSARAIWWSLPVLALVALVMVRLKPF